MEKAGLFVEALFTGAVAVKDILLASFVFKTLSLKNSFFFKKV
jgi:hypothetical protein